MPSTTPIASVVGRGYTYSQRTFPAGDHEATMLLAMLTANPQGLLE